MSDPTIVMTTASAGLAGLAMLVFAGLSGWRGWLQLKQQQLAQYGGSDTAANPAGVPSAAARIEMADLKERIRKLEAIAAGVEL